jgi:ketosteroid isomerase-like protein
MLGQSIFRSAMLAALLFTPIVEAADSTSSDQEALMQSERDWAQAWSKKDPKAVDFEANEYSYTDYDGTVTGRADDAKLLKSPTFSLSYDVDDMKARVFGDTGVVIGRQTQKGTNDGRDIGGVFRFTDTWVKRDGRWYCVASQITRIEKT